jgi:hypothetical protein
VDRDNDRVRGALGARRGDGTVACWASATTSAPVNTARVTIR